MARILELSVVAEGVETEGQINILQDLGCDRVQGYYFSPPVPEHKAREFFARLT
jgi:EAL domain-containing protein (putative c-di-GMP-specific phosphodiesterase class I)